MQEIMYASSNHELRTPINVIINCIKYLKLKADPSLMKWVNICDTSSQFLLCLVNDTLDFASMKVGKFSLSKSKVNVQKMLKDVADLF